MKLMKIFDCQDMPDDVRKQFFEDSEKGNDCYVDWYLDVEICTLVDSWLLDNGANEGEHALIKHWW